MQRVKTTDLDTRSNMAAAGTTRNIQLGPRVVSYPSEQLQQLEDCNSILHDVEALHRRMDDKGYLYIRGFHNREEVLQARLAVLNFIRESGENRLSSTAPWQDGVLHPGCGVGCVPFMEGNTDLTNSPAIHAVFEGQRAFGFFEKYFGEKVITFDYKWLRAMPNNGFTGAHVDRVYMGKGSSNLLTMWTPIGDVPIEMGVLAVCEGSHRLPGFEKFQDTYGNLDVDDANLDGTGWFTKDPFEITEKFGGRWLTTDFQAGDVLIFPMRTVHMSTTNTTQFARISCDTRWQPASEQADSRFMGVRQPVSSQYGLYSNDASLQKNSDSSTGHARRITMEELRKQWEL
ncbi:uncharacterized protein LOC112566785 isoform X1 [Pomacea canaliculata]|uniref:uncharacterized protein LOC112566785 isoform X1 n=2 Tax=Pomacea canaliculata TaxID=400727 RepID=UPI000D73019C|nr:uncharacterized protein LOC112566785 isoform X1 [Pomacea canaliculata]XP_025098927.1 uncharacterized protein LOC112566785 isoform X1 [Pomacea canaliculata]